MSNGVACVAGALLRSFSPSEAGAFIATEANASAMERMAALLRRVVLMKISFWLSARQC
jgi:hypothetical protein